MQKLDYGTELLAVYKAGRKLTARDAAAVSGFMARDCNWPVSSCPWDSAGTLRDSPEDALREAWVQGWLGVWESP